MRQDGMKAYRSGFKERQEIIVNSQPSESSPLLGQASKMPMKKPGHYRAGLYSLNIPAPLILFQNSHQDKVISLKPC